MKHDATDDGSDLRPTASRCVSAETPLRLPQAVRLRLDAAARDLLYPQGTAPHGFAQPPGEPALAAPGSVSWQVFKNPLALFIGGVTAVILELAEPRVRTGVWQHTSFREQPLARMRRTGLAAMTTVYGARSRAEALIAQVVRMHERIDGVTPDGQRFRASEPELLDWVHATASFGFLEAYETYVHRFEDDTRDRYYAEGRPAALLYGATGAPRSQAGLRALFDAMQPKLERSAIVFEFLRIVGDAALLPGLLKPMQPLFVKAAVEITPVQVRERLGLDARWNLRRWQRWLVTQVARLGNRLVLVSNPAVQSCRRLGLPDDHLYRRDGRQVRKTGRP